ncbi:hypothetical protein K458DRAFT_357870 [Lentithecium fluviatile CBS 122367]|uniref:FabD/lysophospholipase-like protein n=1 Tax=Lentithecium fluviatile CBS 122367 TaxID=1168545 RepID=A0A6G1JGH4_9PLEO|nr:hypothetical protein K458DRAFT_357870 [Lentithecium fluviatile CBS 122367]
MTSQSCGRQGCDARNDPVWYCVDCSCWRCDDCWGNYPNHASGDVGRDGLEHEKTRYEVYRDLQRILAPHATLHTQEALQAIEELHTQDLDSTWFGIRRDSNARPLLADYDIYSALMGHPLSNGRTRFPQLASFIGQTNAGKSTLIKMLIDIYDEAEHGDDSPRYPSPVVASAIHTHVPTSSDVHLYADPQTYRGLTPLLYADCEGFDGGERLPIGAIEKRNPTQHSDTTFSRLTPGRTRQLEWASSPDKQAREYAVKQMYPRILYTFSDVVVFVLRNARTFESSVLKPLVEWGVSSLEKSINQPTRPHAIIVLNDTDLGVPAEEWNVSCATRSLLAANESCLHPLSGPQFFTQLANQWKAMGKRIDGILDLLKCYYSTFKVVRIPTKGRYQLMHDQVRKLHDMIERSCDASFETKKQARMLSSSEELHVYLQSAFDHYAQTLDRPFNFVEISLRNNPIPDNFGGHILQLALAVQAHGRRRSGRWIFGNICSLVASSMMLDFARHRKGQPEILFDSYEEYCRFALEEFCDLYSPCEFKSKTERCANFASTHDKGHQNAKGKIIGPGKYISRFRPDNYYSTWREDIKSQMAAINRELQNSLRGARELTEEEELLKIHSDLMEELYDDIGCAGDILSHSTCFCCLMQAPKHRLPCGHVLCTPCVRSYSDFDARPRSSRFVLTMTSCPLHPTTTRWRSPCIIRLKPDHAGVRLLCLDGGGIRGIVELEVLRAIQDRLENRIPLRAFFDLVIGTSTGGIISLGFGAKNWNIEKCISRFKTVCSRAFTARTLQGIPIMKHMVTLKHGSRYKTTPLRESLRIVFGQESLFGYSRDATHAPMVAVTATDEAYKTPIILANYSREDGKRSRRRRSRYEFPRPDNPDLELKIWEAAAATSAAPTFFKPFCHFPTKRTYVDGAVYYNNPVRLVHQERKLLWPDVAGKHPDILLSIGTGQNEVEVHRDLPPYPSQPRLTRRRRRVPEPEAPKSAWTPFPRLKQIYAGMQNRMDSILDAEKMWRDFCSDVADVDSSNTTVPRYIRINPDLSCDPPNLDDLKEMEDLQAKAQRSLESPDSLAHLESVALILVASCFYYERTTVPRSEKDNMYSCSGQICCRFEDDSDYLRCLGEYFRLRQQATDFRPFFEIENDSDPTQVERIPIRPVDISRMTDMASFDLVVPDIRVLQRTTKITISLHLRSRHLPTKKYPISGFPREIMTEHAHGGARSDIPLNSWAQQRSTHRPSLGFPLEPERHELPSRRIVSNRSVSDSYLSSGRNAHAGIHELHSDSNQPDAQNRRTSQRLGPTHELPEGRSVSPPIIRELSGNDSAPSTQRPSRHGVFPIADSARPDNSTSNPQRWRRSQNSGSASLISQSTPDNERAELPDNQARIQPPGPVPRGGARQHPRYHVSDLGDHGAAQIRESIKARLDRASHVAGECARREIERRRRPAGRDAPTAPNSNSMTQQTPTTVPSSGTAPPQPNRGQRRVTPLDNARPRGPIPLRQAPTQPRSNAGVLGQPARPSSTSRRLAASPSIASILSDESVMDNYSEYFDPGLEERRIRRAASPLTSEVESTLSDDMAQARGRL